MNDYANDEIKTSLVNTGLLEEVLCNQAEMAKILVDIKANL